MSSSADVPEIVHEIQRHVNLVGIRLVRGKFELLAVPQVTPSEWELDMNARVGGNKPPGAEGFIQIVVGLDIVARPSVVGGKDKAANAASISSDFGIDYRIADVDFYRTITDADVLQFGARNGLFNAWPFLRAHIQGITASMVLPIVLPTYRP